MRLHVNGIELNVERRGEGPALLLLHGFTGSAASWSAFDDAWSGYSALAVDLIGHGRSDSPPDAGRYTMAACISDLDAVIEMTGFDRVAMLGYSLGGRVALRFALRHPERLWALLLASASPGIEDETERRARVQADEALALRLERDGLKAFIDYWQSIPLWASQARLPADPRAALRRHRLQNSVTGLANSLRGMGAGADAAVLNRLAALNVPALVMAGSLDDRYCEVARSMAAALPAAELSIIEEAGHAAHLEQPEAFAAAVSGFLHSYAPVGSRKARL